MNVIIFLLSVSLTVALSFLVAYIWSVKTGQFDDDYSPAQRILFDDAVSFSSPKEIILSGKKGISKETKIDVNYAELNKIKNENQK